MLSKLKGKRLYSILNKKCPVCHEGDFFHNNNAYDIKNLSKNYSHCSKCGHKYEKETGFFYGAMYVSYAFTVAQSVAIGVAIWILVPGASYYTYLAAILIGLFLLMPVSYSISRMIWMNLFTHYHPDAIENFNKKTAESN